MQKQTSLTVDSIQDDGSFSAKVTSWIQDGDDRLGVKHWRASSGGSDRLANLIAPWVAELAAKGYPAIDADALDRMQGVVDALA